MHENDLWLPANLRVDGHGENEAVVLAIGKVKLLAPQLLHHGRINKALGSESDGARTL